MYILPSLGFVLGLLTFLFVIVCLFMMLVILIQKPRGGGLTGAFGGAGGSATSVFGAKTGDVLTWFTVVCFVLFILLAMGLTWAGRPGETLDTPIIESTPTTNPFGTPGTPGTPATPGTGAPATSDSSKDSLLPSDRTPVTPTTTPQTPAKTDTPAPDAPAK